MFGFSRSNADRLSEADYQREFKHLTDKMWQQHSVDDTPHDELLHAMAVIEHDLMSNNGENWDHSEYSYYLELVRERLLSEPGFPEQAKSQIARAADIILKCGSELEEVGASSTVVKPSVIYLAARVVDWCRAHPPG